MRILVTGGAGFVGVTLCRVLCEGGYDLGIIDNFRYGEARRSTIERYGRLEVIDILDAGALGAAVRAFAPQVVVHLAAIHFIPECNREPVEAATVNIVGTERVLQACEGLDGLDRVIVTSSAAVYPISDEALGDDHPTAPTDIYGITKATNERQAEQFAQRTGIRAISVRLFNVFGPGETNPHVVPEIVRQIKEGQTAIALGNLEPKRSYIHVDDVADAYVRMLTCELPDPHTRVNLGHDDEVSVRELVEMMQECLGRPIEIVQDPERVRASDRMHLKCNTTRICAMLGWEPRHAVAEGVRALLEGEGIACR